MQQVGEAVRLAAGHQHDSLALGRVGDAPFHGKLARYWRKRLAKAIEIKRQRIGPNLMPHEEPATLMIGVVIGLGDPAVVGR